MKPHPRYYVREIGGHVLPFDVSGPGEPSIARCSTKEAAEAIAAALNAEISAVAKTITGALFARAADTIAKAIAAAIVPQLNNPTTGPAPAADAAARAD